MTGEAKTEAVPCTLCPRNCGAIRTADRGGGVCGMPWYPVAARAMLHPWEEPCLTGSLDEAGSGGAGAVFFSGCSLRCRFCQNRLISRDGYGKPLTPDHLRHVFRDLIARGAACLDLVTPTHFTPVIAEALEGERWGVPVVWNSGGYEKPETLRLLEGKVQIWLPDLKYALADPARRYSGAADYVDWAQKAIREMFRQAGPYRMEGGRLVSGVLIRHLILPGELENTRRVIDWVSGTFQPGEVLFSLMSQYTPPEEWRREAEDRRREAENRRRNPEEWRGEAEGRKAARPGTGSALAGGDSAGSKPRPAVPGQLFRRITGAEYRAAVAYMENCGITEGYVQERSSAQSGYTPVWDLTGL